MKPFIHLILYLLLVQLSPVYSGTTSEKILKFESITLTEGLSQGMINCIIQDRFGFMWFATKDGLNRFDGHHFVVYRHNPADIRTVADNFIEKIFEDSKGRIWIGTSSKGLDLFDRKTETFQHFKHDPKNPNSLCNDEVTEIVEDTNGNIWITTNNCLSVIAIEYDSILNKDYYRFELVDQNKSTVFILNNADVYVTNSGNTYLLRNENEILKKLPFDNSKYHANNQTLKLIVKDHILENSWYFFQNSISNVNDSETIITTYSDIIFHSGTFLGPGWMDASGLIWFCNLDRLIQFDTRSGKLTRILSDDKNLSRALSSINYVYRDRSGIMWIGTKGFGILKYNPRSEKFHHTDQESIYALSAMLNGQVLVCKVTQKNVSIFDKEKSEYIYTIPDFSAQNKKTDFKSSSLECVVQDDSGLIWIGQQKLIKFDKKLNQGTIYNTNKFCFPIYKDRMNRIWCGTENAFSLFDSKTDEFINNTFPFTISIAPYKFLQVILQDESGIFWLGTTRGLLRFDERNKSWQEYKNIPDDTTSLSFDLIFSLCEDPFQPAKFLWVGTTGGLNKFDKETGKCIRYTETDGLPNNVIYGILTDRKKNLWLSTNKGLSKFNSQINKFRNFDINDGLQSNEFSRYAYSKTGDGILFFGGVNGFNYFDPRELVDNPFKPPVLIIDFKLNNKSISFHEPGSPISAPIYLTEEVTLEFKDNMISFDFASLDFTAPEKNQYKYKLEGFDDEWINSGSDYSATYTNLNPGTYEFKVIASNNDGIWNEEGTTLKLIILTPWYMAWWFRLLLLAFVTILIYLIYRYRLKQELRVLKIRDRIASDLHDEIGSTLSSVSLFSEIVRKRMKNNTPELNVMMSRIIENINNMMEAMSDIVWTINSRNDRFENILNRMRANAAELFEAKGFHLHIEFDEGLNAVKLGMEDRKNVYLIFKEAINNSAKYSNGKNVWIKLFLQNRKIHLIIKDDGIGFEINEVREGNGIISMKKRAEELKGMVNITSISMYGTTVDLEFPITRISD